MTIAIRVVIILLLIFIPIVLGAQDLYQLSPNEYRMGMGLAFAENSTTVSGDLAYGVLPSVKGLLGVGLEFAEDSDPEISIPPAPLFRVGLGSIRPLAQTGLNYLSTSSFSVEFAKIINEYTDEEAHLRTIWLSGGLGISKEINLESNLTLAPFVAIISSHSWVTVEALGISETDSDSAFSGQIGLDVGISPKVNLIGSVVFSFEESDMAYSVYLAFHPHHRLLANSLLK